MPTTTKNVVREDERQVFRKRISFPLMLGIVISTIIGSSIFFQNGNIMNLTDSTILTFILWILSSIIVFFVTISGLEAISSSRKNKQQGSFGIWVTNFYGSNIGRFIGIFSMYVYLPITMAILSFFAANQLDSSIVAAINSSFSLTTNPNYIFSNSYVANWVYLLTTILISIIIVTIIYLMQSNISRKRQLKTFMGLLFLKVIAIYFIIFLVFVSIFVPTTSPSSTTIPGIWGLWNVGPGTKNTINSNNNGVFVSLSLALPLAVFTFNGFFSSGVLQSETDHEGTYSKSVFFALIFLIITYLLFSYAILAASNGQSYSIFSVIYSLLPNQLWLAFILNLVVIISIMSVISLFFVYEARNTSGLAILNLIPDKNNNYIKWNNKGIVRKSINFAYIITLVWIFLLAIFNTLWLSLAMYWNGYSLMYMQSFYPLMPIFNSQLVNQTHIESVFTSVTVLLIFVVYGMLIFGGIRNRMGWMDHKVDVKPVPFFMFFAIGSIIFIPLMVVFAISGYIIQNISRSYEFLAYLAVAIFFIITTTFYLIINMNKSKWMNRDEELRKRLIINYVNSRIYSGYLNKTWTISSKSIGGHKL